MGLLLVCTRPVVVSARKERPNFIIVAGFLATHDRDLSLRQKLFTMGEDRVECILERVTVCPARLKLARRVDLPPTWRCWLAAGQPRILNTLGWPARLPNHPTIPGSKPRTT